MNKLRLVGNSSLYNTLPLRLFIAWRRWHIKGKKKEPFKHYFVSLFFQKRRVVVNLDEVEQT